MVIPNYWNGCSSGCYPAYGPNAITTPPEYDESASIVQQIAYLLGLMESMKKDVDFIKANAITMPVLENAINALEVKMTELSNANLQLAKDYADAQDEKMKGYLLNIIAELENGTLIWDVTQGRASESKHAMRALFDWVTVHAMDVSTLGTWETVADLANCGLNVRGVAVYSLTELMPDSKPVSIYIS